MPNSQSRFWIFTLHGERDELGAALLTAELAERYGICYAIWQLECGQGTDRIHAQGYLEYGKNQKLSTVKKLLPGAHVEVRKGTREQARDYCRKSDTFVSGPWELGTFKKKEAGKRNDLLRVKDLIDAGVEEADIADQEFVCWAKNYRSLREYKRIKTERRDWKTFVIVYYGETGTGKSKAARNDSSNSYWVPPSNKWFDGYEGQDIVVIDDFYGGFPYAYFLRMTDRYPMQVESKGGTHEFVPKKILITSNKHPSCWYKQEYDYAPIERRIDEIYHFSWNADHTVVNIVMEKGEDSHPQDDTADASTEKDKENNNNKVVDLTCDEEVVDGAEHSEEMEWPSPGSPQTGDFFDYAQVE